MTQGCLSSNFLSKCGFLVAAAETKKGIEPVTNKITPINQPRLQIGEECATFVARDEIITTPGIAPNNNSQDLTKKKYT